jgi:hypothetical protein
MTITVNPLTNQLVSLIDQLITRASSFVVVFFSPQEAQRLAFDRRDLQIYSLLFEEMRPDLNTSLGQSIQNCVTLNKGGISTLVMAMKISVSLCYVLSGGCMHCMRVSLGETGSDGARGVYLL